MYQTFHAGCSCQHLKRSTCTSGNIVLLFLPCLAFSHRLIFNLLSAPLKILFPRVQRHMAWKQTRIDHRKARQGRTGLVLYGVLHQNLSSSDRHSHILDCLYSENPARCLVLHRWASSYLMPPVNEIPHWQLHLQLRFLINCSLCYHSFYGRSRSTASKEPHHSNSSCKTSCYKTSFS